MTLEKGTVDTTYDDDRYIVAATDFSFEQLADIYNQARVDYIVPMPMNAKRMAEYVNNYDISLDASYVSFNSDDLETGVGMVGLRDVRAWITRLGVVPRRRGKRIGQYLMETMIDYAATHGYKYVQLEVIVGNEPARKLFVKLGFEKTRELMIIRRPPGKPEHNPDYERYETVEITKEQIPELLAQRKDNPSWVEETQSMLNTGSLCGYQVTSPNGEQGWIIYQRSPFQLQHVVFSQSEDTELSRAMLYTLHSKNAMQDTKVENVPINAAVWSAYQSAGYMEVFHRTEMLLKL